MTTNEDIFDSKQVKMSIKGLKSGKNDPKRYLRVSTTAEFFKERESFLKSSFIHRALSLPFAPKWAFGVDIYTKFINLTTQKSNYKIFYTVSHVGIIYNHAYNDMQFLMGHRNVISCTSADESGKWLVTADLKEDNSIIVWDSENCFPVRTIFDPHPMVGASQIAISYDAKYLASIGDEKEPVVKFWLWTLGNDEPDGTYIVRKNYGFVRKISFNPNNCTHFAVTFTENLIFFTWKKKNLTESISDIPRKRAKNFGHYTDTTYIPYSHECLTVTTSGWVIVWGLTFFTVPYDSMPDNNNKLFLKAVRLQKDGIGSICYVDGVISTTDYQGNIRFFDENLKILFLFHQRSLPRIVLTQFNLGERKFIVQNPEVMDSVRTKSESEEQNDDEINDKQEETKEIQQEEYEIENIEEQSGENQEIKDTVEIKQDETENECEIEGKIMKDDTEKSPKDFKFSFEPDQDEEVQYEDDRSEEYEKIYLNLLSSDFTLQRSPFLVRDYIILTTDGQFAYVDAVENKLDFFLNTNYSSITCIDVHSEKPIVILGYENGFLYTYDYEECKLITKRRVTNSKDQYFELTSIRYSYQGFFLVCGTYHGQLLFLDPITITQNHEPFCYEHSAIVDIRYSQNNQFLAYYDVSCAVCLLKLVISEDQQTQNWVFYGRIIAHTREITGLLFCELTRLFTISKDRYLVEYYTKESHPGKLEIISRIPILQRGYPLAFTNYTVMNEEGNIYFLVSTNEYKYLIINEQTSTLERTILAPFFGMPVHQMRIIPKKNDKYLIFCTSKHLGIQSVPVSGNPYKQVSLIAHSTYIQNFRISNCGRFVFTFGSHDNVCIMWSIRSDCVDYMFGQGGFQLSPYYSLIEGGADGWLFREVKDLFYYMQILHQGEDSPFPRNVSDKIPIAEIPNLLRAIGFYPTEFELDNILYEIKFYYLDNVDEDEEEEINFENFIKLYINHRHVKNFRGDELKWAFNCFAEDGKIPRQRFIQALCRKGECFSDLSLQHCLSILTHLNFGEQRPRYGYHEMLPEELTFDYFMSEILGVEDSEFQE